MRRVSLRLLPLLFLLDICNFLDRTNVAIAALQMNRDLHFSATAYGFGAGSSARPRPDTPAASARWCLRSAPVTDSSADVRDGSDR
jgi:hypothetical protein